MVLLDTLIDNNFISFMEYGGKEGMTFKRVDASMEGLTETGESDEDTRKALEEKFRKALKQPDLTVRLEKFRTGELPAMITVEEQSRRFSEMAKQLGQRHGDARAARAGAERRASADRVPQDCRRRIPT